MRLFCSQPLKLEEESYQSPLWKSFLRSCRKLLLIKTSLFQAPLTRFQHLKRVVMFTCCTARLLKRRMFKNNTSTMAFRPDSQFNFERKNRIEMPSTLSRKLKKGSEFKQLLRNFKRQSLENQHPEIIFFWGWYFFFDWISLSNVSILVRLSLNVLLQSCRKLL